MFNSDSVKNEQPIPYRLRVSRRAKRMRIAVYPGTFKRVDQLSIEERKSIDFNNKFNFKGKGAWVYSDSSVVLTLPWGFSQKFSQKNAEKFIRQKQQWILKSLNYFRRFGNRVVLKSGKREYRKYKEQALALAIAKVESWNRFYGLSYNRINIKNQKTRWGSCSKKGNLNFNYKIVHLPEPVLDYLIVHELCHLKEFNHSKNFWLLVSQAIPEYKKLRGELRSFGRLSR